MPQAGRRDDSPLAEEESNLWCGSLSERVESICGRLGKLCGLKHLKEDWKWLLVGLFFVTWTGIYLALFIYAIQLGVNVTNISDCIINQRANCVTEECVMVGTSMLIFAICGFFLFINLSILALALWNQKVKNHRKEQNALEMGLSEGRARRGGMDMSTESTKMRFKHTASKAFLQTLPARHRSRSQDQNKGAPSTQTISRSQQQDQQQQQQDQAQQQVQQQHEIRSEFEREERELEETELAIEMTSPSETREEMARSSSSAPPRSRLSSTAPPEPATKPAYIIRPLKFLECCVRRFEFLFARCPNYYVNPAECSLRLGREHWLDAHCFISWSTVGAQLCMFPWFVLFITCTITVVARTDPKSFGYDEGICRVSQNSTQKESELNEAGVQLTWFSVIFTWIIVALFGIFAIVLSVCRKIKRGGRLAPAFSTFLWQKAKAKRRAGES